MYLICALILLLMFSKACEYGLKAFIYLAEQHSKNQNVGIKEIARETKTPEPFCAKVLQLAARHSLLHSVKGPHGGFRLKRSPDKIRLSDIVDVIDGDRLYTGCALGFEECNASNPCPIHDKFVEVRQNLKVMLVSTSLEELSTSVKAGKSSLIEY